MDDSAPRNSGQLENITDTLADTKGQVQRVRLKTQITELELPITKLLPSAGGGVAAVPDVGVWKLWLYTYTDNTLHKVYIHNTYKCSTFINNADNVAHNELYASLSL